MLNQKWRVWIFAGLSLLLLNACAGAGTRTDQDNRVYQLTVEAIFDHIYDLTYKTLEESKLYVVRELNIGASMKKNKERWGDNYNKNGYEEVRALVLCNVGYANEVLNRTPELMTLCPLTVTFLHKEGRTSILYARRAPIAEGSASFELFTEIDSTVVKAIRSAVSSYSEQ